MHRPTRCRFHNTHWRPTKSIVGMRSFSNAKMIPLPSIQGQSAERPACVHMPQSAIIRWNRPTAHPSSRRKPAEREKQCSNSLIGNRGLIRTGREQIAYSRKPSEQHLRKGLSDEPHPPSACRVRYAARIVRAACLRRTPTPKRSSSRIRTWWCLGVARRLPVKWRKRPATKSPTASWAAVPT